MCLQVTIGVRKMYYFSVLLKKKKHVHMWQTSSREIQLCSVCNGNNLNTSEWGCCWDYAELLNNTNLIFHKCRGEHHWLFPPTHTLTSDQHWPAMTLLRQENVLQRLKYDLKTVLNSILHWDILCSSRKIDIISVGLSSVTSDQTWVNN